MITTFVLTRGFFVLENGWIQRLHLNYGKVISQLGRQKQHSTDIQIYITPKHNSVVMYTTAHCAWSILTPASTMSFSQLLRHCDLDLQACGLRLALPADRPLNGRLTLWPLFLLRFRFPPFCLSQSWLKGSRWPPAWHAGMLLAPKWIHRPPTCSVCWEIFLKNSLSETEIARCCD